MILKRTSAFLLAILTLLLTVCAATAVYGDDNTVSVSSASLDHSDPEGAFGISLSPSELLSLLIGGELSAAEAEYLDRYSEFTVSCSTPWDPTSIEVVKNGDKLSVKAESYSYTAENGTVVTWTPKKATAGETEKDFSVNDSSYTCEIDASDAETVDVLYSCTISLDADVAETILNFAYNQALSAKSLKGADGYVKALSDWRNYVNAMEKYRDDLAAYEKYEKDLADYTDQKKKYDAYVKEYDAYVKKLADYEKYIADYNAYLAAKTEYERKYLESTESNKKYVEYLNNLNKIRACMHTMESVYTRPTSNKTGTLHRALQNPDLIVMFEKYKSLLAGYGVKESQITELRRVSDELAVLLDEYAEAREVSEAAAFAYYREHYTQICEKFNFVYDGMSGIMTKRNIFLHICAKIELEYGTGEMGVYKKWRIKNVLAHVYLICLSLDDKRTAEGTWDFYSDSGDKHTYYFSDILDQNLILPDTNSADPSSLTWIDEPVRIPLPTVPVPPKPVAEPIAPAAVQRPTEPTAVQKPTEPPKVDEPIAPSVEDFSTIRKTAAIVEELNANRLVERQVSDDNRKIELTHTLTRSVPTAEPKVSLYGHDGRYLKSIQTQNGEYSEPAAWEQESDEVYSYEFQGWSQSPYGVIAPLASTDSDICLWAIYEKTLREYTVTVNGVEMTEKVAYGELPPLPEDPKKESSNTTDYTFAGWSPEPFAVTGDVEYTAQYVESERLYEVVFDTADGEIIRKLPYEETPTAPVIRNVYYEGLTRYEFSGWDTPIRAVTENARYTAQYTSTVLVSGEGEMILEDSFDSYIIKSGGAPCNVTKLLELAKNEEKNVKFVFGSMTATIDSKAAKSLLKGGAANAALVTDTAGGMGIDFSSDNGSSVPIREGELRISLGVGEGQKGVASIYEYYANGTHRTVASSEANGEVSFIASPNATYRISRIFSLTQSATAGGKVLLESQLYEAGAYVGAFLYPDTEYYVSSIKLINNETGAETVLENVYGLTMPAYDATLSVEFAQKKYTVTFIARGSAISSEQYLLGETVNVPQAPSDYEENGYRYTFIGWTRPIAAVTSDAEYTAKYFAVPISQSNKKSNVADDGSAWATGKVIFQQIIPLLVLLVVIVVGGTVITVLLVKGRKKKKKNKQDIKKEK